MKAVIASIFAVSVVLAGAPAQAADVNNEGAVINSALESTIVIAALTNDRDVASDEEKKTDDEKSDDKKSDEEKKTDDEKKSD